MNIDLSSSLSPLLDQPSSQPEPLEDLQARLRRRHRRRRQVKAGLVAVTVVLATAVVVVPLTRDQPNTVDTVDDQQDDHPDTSAPDPFAPGIPMTAVTFEDADGTPWRFDVYESATELCMRKGASGGGMCGPPASADSDWVMGFAMGDTQGAVNDLFGTARNDVDRIEIRLDTGAVIHRSRQGQEMGFSVGFFAARIPIGTRVTMVVGFDRKGNELERIIPQGRRGSRDIASRSDDANPTDLDTVSWSAAAYPLKCDDVGVEVLQVEYAEPSPNVRVAIVMVACAAGAGTPPRGVYVFDSAASNRAPHLLQTLSVDDATRITGRIEVHNNDLEATGGTYSSTDARCCPQGTFTARWQWRDGRYVPTE